ncbi:dihydrodipicolinate synthase family protein [uncultured Castellaniella sp.]|uniref:dihydrodipicolinate synthase family protein n=1 Tax=uncultured Castellaniella sp. TaxID=647907 RepID=UPI002626E285|nr:dihydrodipicolinate synthase family protein [uncultured Castellaniella sp.]
MTFEQYRKALHGVSGVHATAYAADGDIDAALTGRIVRRIAQAGVHNIVSGGNTGEFFSLTDAETRRLHAVAIQAAEGGAAVTAAVGRSLKEAIATARAAKGEGADGVMAHQPRDPFAAPSAQIDYFLDIADAVDLPVVAYVRADDIPLAELVRLATHPAIAGVKFASRNLMLFGDCIRATQGLGATWICGLAERWALPFYALGGAGFTSGLVNVAPELSLATWRALELGDFSKARHLVDLIAPFEAMRTQFHDGANVTVVKEALQLQGLPVGKVRLPGLPELSGEDRQALRGILDTWTRASAA